MMHAADIYAATLALKPGAYAGQARDALTSRATTCAHVHKSRSAALACAETLVRNIGALEVA